MDIRGANEGVQIATIGQLSGSGLDESRVSITDLILCLVACGLGGKERIPSAVGEKMMIVHRASKAEQRVPRGLGRRHRPGQP